MKVTYQRMYPIGQYLNEKIGFEMELGPDALTTETEILESVEHLKKLCDQAHQKLNPELSDIHAGDIGQSIKDQQVEKQPSTTIAELIADINSCTEVKTLEAYRLLVKKDPAMQFAYDRKMEQLTKS